MSHDPLWKYGCEPTHGSVLTRTVEIMIWRHISSYLIYVYIYIYYIFLLNPSITYPLSRYLYDNIYLTLTFEMPIPQMFSQPGGLICPFLSEDYCDEETTAQRKRGRLQPLAIDQWMFQFYSFQEETSMSKNMKHRISFKMLDHGENHQQLFIMKFTVSFCGLTVASPQNQCRALRGEWRLSWAKRLNRLTG